MQCNFLITFFRYLLVAGLFLSSINAAILTEERIERDYAKYRTNVYQKALDQARGTPFEKVCPAVAFVNWYQKPLDVSVEAFADVQALMIGEGFGLGGIDTSRTANDIETVTLLSKLKESSTNASSIEFTTRETSIEHRDYVKKAFDVFRSTTPASANETKKHLRSMTDGLDYLVQSVGKRDMPDDYAQSVGKCDERTRANQKIMSLIDKGIMANLGYYQSLISDSEIAFDVVKKEQKETSTAKSNEKMKMDVKKETSTDKAKPNEKMKMENSFVKAAINCFPDDSSVKETVEKLKNTLAQRKITLVFDILPGADFNKEVIDGKLTEYDIFFYFPGATNFPVFEELRSDFDIYKKAGKTGSVLHIQHGYGEEIYWWNPEKGREKETGRVPFPSGYFLNNQNVTRIANYFLISPSNEDGANKFYSDDTNSDDTKRFYSGQFDRLVNDMEWFAKEKQNHQYTFSPPSRDEIRKWRNPRSYY